MLTSAPPDPMRARMNGSSFTADVADSAVGSWSSLGAAVVGAAVAVAASIALADLSLVGDPDAEPAWILHAIDDRYDSPDGTKLADIDGDGLVDVVTGWEHQGLTVLYLNPGPDFVRRQWPSVVVGRTPKAEDAAFVDLDSDGRLEIVTSCEQHVEQVFVHSAPPSNQELLTPQAWRQERVPALDGRSQWMFAEPILLADGTTRRTALVVGGKNYNRDQTATLGLLLPGPSSSTVADSTYRELAKVSWVMSIISRDVDGDGDPDIIYSDKHGPGCGVWWLENAGRHPAEAPWSRHEITAGLDSAMLIAAGDLDADGTDEIVAPVDLVTPEGQPRRRAIRILRRGADPRQPWAASDIPVPADSGHPKAVTVGDVNRDGRVDIVATSTGAEGGQMGCYWLESGPTPFRDPWRVHRIAGPAGIKYDLVHLLDLDADGDLDVLTNEEKEDERGIGVCWYENPGTQPPNATSASRER